MSLDLTKDSEIALFVKCTHCTNGEAPNYHYGMEDGTYSKCTFCDGTTLVKNFVTLKELKKILK